MTALAAFETPIIQGITPSIKDFSVYIIRVSAKADMVISAKENASLLEAGSFLQSALNYFQFEVRNLPEDEYYLVEVTNQRGTLEMYEIQH